MKEIYNLTMKQIKCCKLSQSYIS